MPKIIKNGRVYGGAPSESVWEGTQAQYDAIENKDPNITYYITDGAVEPIPATNVEYDNSLSGLSATQVQSAIDEVDDNIDNATTKTSSTIGAGTGCVVRLASLVKINGVVFGSFAINMTTPISSRTTIGSIPVGFRPYTNVSYIAPSSSAVNYYQDRITNVIITTGGEIIAGDMVVPAGQTVKEVNLAFSYNQGN